MHAARLASVKRESSSASSAFAGDDNAFTYSDAIGYSNEVMGIGESFRGSM